MVQVDVELEAQVCEADVQITQQPHNAPNHVFMRSRRHRIYNRLI